MNNYFYVEVDEEITTVVGKLRKNTSQDIFIVVPKRALIAQSLVNLKLLAKEAQRLGKKLVFVSPDPHVRKLAEKAGLLVKRSFAPEKKEEVPKRKISHIPPQAPTQWEEEALKKELEKAIRKGTTVPVSEIKSPEDIFKQEPQPNENVPNNQNSEIDPVFDFATKFSDEAPDSPKEQENPVENENNALIPDVQNAAKAASKVSMDGFRTVAKTKVVAAEAGITAASSALEGVENHVNRRAKVKTKRKVQPRKTLGDISVPKKHSRVGIKAKKKPVPIKPSKVSLDIRTPISGQQKEENPLKTEFETNINQTEIQKPEVNNIVANTPDSLPGPDDFKSILAQSQSTQPTQPNEPEQVSTLQNEQINPVSSVAPQFQNNPISNPNLRTDIAPPSKPLVSKVNPFKVRKINVENSQNIVPQNALAALNVAEPVQNMPETEQGQETPEIVPQTDAMAALMGANMGDQVIGEPGDQAIGSQEGDPRPEMQDAGAEAGDAAESTGDSIEQREETGIETVALDSDKAQDIGESKTNPEIKKSFSLGIDQTEVSASIPISTPTTTAPIPISTPTPIPSPTAAPVMSEPAVPYKEEAKVESGEKEFGHELANLTLKERERLRELWTQQRGIVRAKVKGSNNLDLRSNQEVENKSMESSTESSGLLKTTHQKVAGMPKIVDLRSASTPLVMATNVNPITVTKDKKKVIMLPLFNVKLFALFVVGTLIILLVLAGIILPSAKVVITPKQAQNDLEVKATLSGETSEAKMSEGIIPAQPDSFQVTENKNFSTSGTKDIQEKAQGQIIVYNKSTKPLALKPNALLETSDGQKFYTKDAVTISAGKPKTVSNSNSNENSNGNSNSNSNSNSNTNTNSSTSVEIEPGSASVAIASDKNGPSNLGDEKMTFPALTDKDFKDLVWARAKGEMTGGESRTAKIISKEELESAQNELLQKAKDDAKSQIDQKIGSDSNKMILFDIKDSKFNSSKNEGDEADSYSVSLEATFFSLSFDKSKLIDLAKYNISGENPSDINVVIGSTNVVESKPLENTMEISSQIQYGNNNAFNQAEIRKSLVLAKKQDADEYLSKNKDIGSYTLNIWPSWLGHLPLLEQRIKVEIQ